MLLRRLVAFLSQMFTFQIKNVRGALGNEVPKFLYVLYCSTCWCRAGMRVQHTRHFELFRTKWLRAIVFIKYFVYEIICLVVQMCKTTILAWVPSDCDTQRHICSFLCFFYIILATEFTDNKYLYNFPKMALVNVCFYYSSSLLVSWINFWRSLFSERPGIVAIPIWCFKFKLKFSIDRNRFRNKFSKEKEIVRASLLRTAF